MACHSPRHSLSPTSGTATTNSAPQRCVSMIAILVDSHGKRCIVGIIGTIRGNHARILPVSLSNGIPYLSPRKGLYCLYGLKVCM